MKCFDCPEKYKCPIYENSPNHDSRMAKVLKCSQMEQNNAPVVTHCLYCDKEVIVPFCDATDFVCGECKRTFADVCGITGETLKLLDIQTHEDEERT